MSKGAIHHAAFEARSLQATLAHVAALDPYLRAQVIEQPHAAWFEAAELATDPRRLNDALYRIMSPYSATDQQIAAQNRHVAASFLINGYAWSLPAAAVGAYLSEGRVPDLAPSNVVIRFKQPTEEDESTLEIAFLSERVVVLPNDPAAGQPEVLVMNDAAQLREWLRTQLEAHMRPLIEAVYRRTRFGRRAQWNLVADDCASLFLWVGKKLQDQERACAEGLAFVGAPGSPLQKSTTGYFTLQYNGRWETFRKRGGGCLYYKLEEGQNCNTCALITEEERDRRLLAYMAKEQE